MPTLGSFNDFTSTIIKQEESIKQKRKIEEGSTKLLQRTTTFAAKRLINASSIPVTPLDIHTLGDKFSQQSFLRFSFNSSSTKSNNRANKLLFQQ